jgi:hypothetical protein
MIDDVIEVEKQELTPGVLLNKVGVSTSMKPEEMNWH